MQEHVADIPAVNVPLPSEGFDLQSPFANLLWSFMGQQIWSGSGFSVYEVYFMFTKQALWTVTISIISYYPFLVLPYMLSPKHFCYWNQVYQTLNPKPLLDGYNQH